MLEIDSRIGLAAGPGGRREDGRVTIGKRKSGGTGQVTAAPDGRYKWVALTNTTAGVLLATIDASIMIIAMPDIFEAVA
jgi:hypothetical protein